MPASLPNGHPAGDPAGNAVKSRLHPPGPHTITRNLFPAFALPKLKFASIRFGFNTTKFTALIRFAVFPTSTANTDVTFPITFGPPATNCVNVKHAPLISTSCRILQFPFDGVTLNTTGALVPNFNAHVAVLVNGPNTLLSPAENVVVTVIVAGPPQHAAGNAVPGSVDIGFSVALTRLQLTGVTLPNTIVASGIESPFVSHASVAADVTVLPGLCMGIPVSLEKPLQIVVTSLGKNPHPTRFNCTAHSALTSPVVPGLVTNVPGTTTWHSGLA